MQLNLRLLWIVWISYQLMFLLVLINSFTNIVFYIQQINGSTQCMSISCESSFDDVLACIHTAIGCEDVHCKPALTSKLDNQPTKSAPAMTFVSDDDWKGCIEDVVNMQRKKKDITPSITMILNNVVSITVFIALPVYSNF